jgi:hypothetical protein
MNITIAVIYVDNTPAAKVEGDSLVVCGVEGQDDGRNIDIVRDRLTDAFQEIYGTSDVEVLFPELGECKV